jgi:hypothetical protein
MGKQGAIFRILVLALVAVVIAILAFPGLAFAQWQKVDPPPDVDKAAHGHTGTWTCWQATAANMLAAAGYGDGTTVQDRADDIYSEMVAHFGTGGGWPDTALTWWLASAHNDMAGSNPYTVVTFYGPRQKIAYQDPNLPEFFGNELRRCQQVGLTIGDPGCAWWHVISVWGDSGGAGELTTNPAGVIVTDSDSDAGGDVQMYSYSANGWELTDYSGGAYITDFTTLCPTDDPSDQVLTQKVVGSLSIHQDSETAATDLHYRVVTDVDILTYLTTIDWETDNPPTIVEGEEDHEEWELYYERWITVDWDLSDNPVPYCTDVTITTEFVLPMRNYIEHRDVYFTYPDPGFAFPGFEWEIDTPQLDVVNWTDICGGYVVGRFDVFTDPGGENLVGEYRFLHEYDYFQDPELHYFSLAGTNETGHFVGNLRFGHSYGFLDADLLREVEEWMTYDNEIYSLNPDYPIEVELDWKDLLPYPEGIGPPPPPTDAWSY